MIGLGQSTNIVGLDVSEDHLRLAIVTRRHGRLKLERTIEVPNISDQTDTLSLTALLVSTWQNENIHTRVVAISLPQGSGYLQSNNDSQPIKEIDFLRSNWIGNATNRKNQTVGYARRERIAKLVEAASNAGLTVKSVDLPQVTAAAAIGLLDQKTAAAPTAGILIEPGRVFFAFTCDGELSDCRTERVETSNADTHSDPVAVAIQMYRAARLRHPNIKTDNLRTIVSPELIESTSFSEQIGVECEFVHPGQNLSLESDDWPKIPSIYTRAIGAAMIGLDSVPRRMTFLQSLSHKPAKNTGLRPQRVVAIAIIAAVIAMAPGWWTMSSRRAELSQLQKQYDASKPLLVQQDKYERVWRTLNPWLLPQVRGQRVQHAEILITLNELFPDPGDAYATSMIVNAGNTDREVRVEISGRARTSEALFNYVSALNQSELFSKASIGTVTDDETNLSYPKQYSLSVMLNGN